MIASTLTDVSRGAAIRRRGRPIRHSVQNSECRTDYDFAGAAEAILATGFPQAEALLVRYILNPPTEEESLRTLAGAELS